MPTRHLSVAGTGLRRTQRRGSTHDGDVGHILDKSDGLLGLESAGAILFGVARGTEYG